MLYMKSDYKNIYRISDYINKKFRDEIDRKEYNELSQNLNRRFANDCDKNIVFSYHLDDAWNRKIATFDIYGNTVKCSYRDDEDEYILQSSAVEEILEIVKKYSDYFQSEDFFIEDSGVWDGYLYRMNFSDGENLYWGVLDNLIFNFGREDYPNTNIMLNFLSEIFSVLEKSGVDKKYLRFER